MPKKIILDTNFILIPFMFNIDIFEQIKQLPFNSEIYYLDLSIKELENIKEKEKKYTKPALELLKTKQVKLLKTEKHKKVDDLLVELGQNDYIIATQDKDLKRRLKFKKIPLVYLRQKKYLKYEE